MEKIEDVGEFEIYKTTDPEFDGEGYIVMDGLIEMGVAKNLDGARAIAYMSRYDGISYGFGE